MSRDRFDYEGAERDIFDNGADPDYLDPYHPDKRDQYLKDLGLNPDDYKDKNHKSGSSGNSDTDVCYLTSACVKARNLADDCMELTVLRNFRDTYMSSTAEGKADIREYYRIAPDIVAAINKKPEAASIWNQLYEDFILPSVQLIKNDNNEGAYQLYKNYTLLLQKKYL